MLQEYPDHWRSSFQIGGPEFLPTDHIAQPGMQAQCTPRGLGLEAGRRTDSDSSERPACPVFGGVSPAAESARARAFGLAACVRACAPACVLPPCRRPRCELLAGASPREHGARQAGVHCEADTQGPHYDSIIMARGYYALCRDPPKIHQDDPHPPARATTSLPSSSPQQGWPSRAESRGSDSRLDDSAKTSDSRLGDSATRAFSWP